MRRLANFQNVPCMLLAIVRAKAEPNRQIGLNGLLRVEHIADSIIRHAELQLPIIFQIGDCYENFAAFDWPRREPVRQIPSQHAPADRSLYQ
jgi:hypothetical protein